MEGDASLGGHVGTIVIRNANIAVLAKVLQAQKQAGDAAIRMLDAAALPPAKGAPEPGKGSMVDVVA